MHERHPKNARGPFYVMKGQCISCGAPPAEAPTLMTMDDDGCYFHRQPETPQEVDAAIRAVFVSCIQVHRYGGDNHQIRRRLAELGEADLCDLPLHDHPQVVRNHVRFKHDGATTARGLASLLRDGLLAASTDASSPRDADGDDDHAAFKLTTSVEYAPLVAWTVDRLDQQWLLRVGGNWRPIWIHDILVAKGAKELRWFSVSEWKHQTEGQPLPY